MEKLFEGSAALFALMAAGFWFASSAKSIPDMVTYWDKAPRNDPFFASIRFATAMNRWAAFFSFLSALCASATFALLFDKG